MPTTDEIIAALEVAGLPVVLVGGLAYASLAPAGLDRSTFDADLAVTLPRDIEVQVRWDTAIATLRPLGLMTNPSLWWREYDFLAFSSSGPVVDLFLNGITDFRERADGNGSGLRTHVDDETGDMISREGLLVSKLVAQRPQDIEDVAGLLLSPELDPELVAWKATHQVTEPLRGIARVLRALRHTRAILGTGSDYAPMNQRLSLHSDEIADRAHVVIEAIESAKSLP